MRRIVVSVGGRVVADTGDGLTMREGSYPPVQYIPRGDVDMLLLQRSAHRSSCPFYPDRVDSIEEG